MTSPNTDQLIRTCASGNFCLAPHVPVTPMHKCRVCGNYLHTFCAGNGSIAPNTEHLGKEYDCIQCSNGKILGWFAPPIRPPSTTVPVRNPYRSSCTPATISPYKSSCSPPLTNPYTSSGSTAPSKSVTFAKPTATSASSTLYLHSNITTGATAGATAGVNQSPSTITTPSPDHGESETSNELVHVDAGGDSNNKLKRPITKDFWLQALQEEAPVGSKGTYAKLYPNLWKVVTKYTKVWVDAKWAIPLKRKNRTDFKSFVMPHLLARRKKMCPHETKDEELLVALFPGKEKVQYYNIDTFEKFAYEVYRIDHAAVALTSAPTSNDVLRVFGIAALSNNREALVSLNTKKNYARSDMDSSLSREDRIYNTFCIQFNDPDLEIGQPTRAERLDSYLDMNPNDDSRIDIQRDHHWIKEVYLKTLKEYNGAMHRWTKGTGGGPGMDENYCDWETRDNEDFKNYGSIGNGDTLAWIYMKDKEIGLLFGNMFQKTPSDLVVEDGVEDVKEIASPMKKRRTTPSQKQALELGKLVSESMENGFSLVADAMKTINAVRHDTNTGLAEAGDMLGSALDLITKTQKQIMDVEKKIEDENSNERHNMNNRYLMTLRRTLEKAYKILDDVNV